MANQNNKDLSELHSHLRSSFLKGVNSTKEARIRNLESIKGAINDHFEEVGIIDFH